MANVFRQFLLDVEHGDLDAVKRNITNGIDLETRDEDEQTALILAARCNHFECVRVLLEAHANVDAEDVDHWTALLNACQNGHFEIVRILVENEANIEHFDCGQFTPLIWASYQGHTRIVSYLLSNGANVDALDEHGISSLAWASGRDHIEVVSVLLEAGASPNLCDKNNTTPLIWASRRGHTRIVDLLLRGNASVNNIGMKNTTALLAAIKGGHGKTALRLLENRTIDIKIQNKDGQTPLSYACAEGLTEVVAELVRRHAYVNTVDKIGDPVLFSAVKGGKEECVAFLLDNHADINAIGSENKTAIWWAVEQGRMHIVKYLLEHRPDIEVSGGPDDDTPLLLAAKRKRVGIVYELIKYGAKLSSVDRAGDNSLHIALRNRSRDIADILLSNPRHAKYLYRPNKRGETPYKIDSGLQKSILTTIFGQRTLNLNDDSILGYDLYSSALAEILSEPSLQTPITVGLYAKWGSGKSALLTHLKDEMHSFAQLTDYPTMRFSPLLFSVVLLVASIVGLLTSVLIHYIVGISLAAALIFIPLIFVFLLRYLLRNKDYLWTATVAQFVKKRLDILRFLLQVMFMNPYAYLQAKTTDTRKMKFIFTEYGKVSIAEGEKACEGMIAELATNIEESFGLVATRLCRALHSKNLSHHRFRHFCGIPAFIVVSMQILLALILAGLALVNGVPSSHRSINMVYILLASALALSLTLSLGTWLRLLIGLIKSPKSKIVRFVKQSVHQNESSLYRLRKEVSHLSYIIKTVEAFLNINTRLVLLIDGLDVCEQQRIIQVLDQVHVLFTRENDPFIILIVCDPHKMMQDITSTTRTVASTTTTQSMFDTSVNGRDYLLSIIQLPIYLQLNLSKTKQLKNNADAFIRRKRNASTLSNGTSIPDVSTRPSTTNQLSKNKRRRQRRDTLPNTKPVTTSELTHQLLQSDYFLDINPRILQRLINIIAMTGRLLRANQVLFSWKRLGCWSYLVEQWPYRISWIIVHYEDHEHDFPEDTALKTLFSKVKLFVSLSNDPLLELDRNGRKFELCIEHSEPVLNLVDLKDFLPWTCNLDPYLNKLIRESSGYYLMTHSDENGLFDGDPSHFNPHPDLQGATRHGGYFPQAPPSSRKGAIHSKFNLPSRSRPYAHVAMKERDYDEDDPHHPRTPSISSSSVPLVHGSIEERPPYFPHSSTDTKLDLSPCLSQLTVKDVCECLKNDINGLKPSMISGYVEDVNENNISGLVLAACELNELKQTLSMTFGDWVLFSNWIRAKRDEERRSRYLVQSSTSHRNVPTTDSNRVYMDNSLLGMALGQLLSSAAQQTYNTTANESSSNGNESVTILPGTKNVKFLIPMSQSGLTSNESTVGANENEHRVIPRVEDIFSSHPLESSERSNFATPASLSDVEHRPDRNETDGEQIPLLAKECSNLI